MPQCLLWATWKERNRVVFEDSPFSYIRSKLSFNSSFYARAGLNVDLYFVRILLCALSFWYRPVVSHVYSLYTFRVVLSGFFVNELLLLPIK